MRRMTIADYLALAFCLLLLLHMGSRGAKMAWESLANLAYASEQATLRSLEKPEVPTTFDLMSPKEHLLEAKKALADAGPPKKMAYRLNDARAHLLAIGQRAPEYREAQKLLGQADDKLNRQEASEGIALRQKYAQELENQYLSQGKDIRVTLEGREKRTIKLYYILFSRPLVYKLSQETDFITSFKTYGFKKVILDNGRESWIYTL